MKMFLASPAVMAPLSGLKPALWAKAPASIICSVQLDSKASQSSLSMGVHPMRTGDISIEPNPYPSYLSPNHPASEAQFVTWDHQSEVVWYSDRRPDIESRSRIRKVPDGAVDGSAAEFNLSSLQYAVPSGNSLLLFHGSALRLGRCGQ